MANVDLNTQKITGAKLGTKKYYHEVGHLKFEEESAVGNMVRVVQDLSFKFLIFAIGFEVLLSNIIFQNMIVCLMVLNIFSEIFEESWCWKFATERINIIEKDGDKHTTKAS